MEMKDLRKENKRLEKLLNNVCEYLTELCKHDKDFFTKKHSKLFFGMTEKEHKKYIQCFAENYLTEKFYKGKLDDDIYFDRDKERPWDYTRD